MKPVLRVGHLPITDHLILGVTKHKLDFQVESFQYSDLQTICMNHWDYVGEAIMGNEIDAAFMLAPYAMELFHSGEKIKLILLGHTTGSIIIKNKRINIEKVEDFKGKTILIPFHLSVHMMLMHQMLTDSGMEVGPGKDVVFEVVAPPQIPQAMEWDEEGDLGGFIVAEPFGAQVVNDGYGEIFCFSKDLWANHPCCVLVVRDEYEEQHPDAVQELVNSLVKSALFVEKKPTEAAKIATRFLKQQLVVLEDVLTNPADRVLYKNLLPDLEPFDQIQNYMTEKTGAMSGKIDLDKFIKLDYAENAGAK
ncbi:MAG: ABC transporter substrate-binding protein [Spirochaetes bacterium]|nr:ABC transporter substrate-binding protein [Spirochaetota bacterium]